MSALLAVWYLLAASALASQQKPAHDASSLRGQVVDGVSGRPIRDLELQLLDIHWQEAAEPTAPDAQGRFIFSGLAPGEYILSGDSPETGHVFFDELPEPGFVQTIRIKPEEQEKTVVFRIMPRILIGGTVRDEFGDPLERAIVTFQRPVWVDQRIVLEQLQQATTDDRGRYRAGRLPPGGYVVCAGAVPGGPGQATAPTAGPVDFASRPAPRVYSETCYPDPGNSQQHLLEVAAGQRIEINLTLIPVPAVSVRGHLLNLPPVGGTGVRLMRESAFDNQQPLFAMAGQDGAFAFRGVLPGHYRLEADANWEEPDGTRKFSLARLPIEVGSSDLEGIDAPLEPAGAIDVSLHGSEGEKIAPEGVQLGLRLIGARSENVHWTQPDGPSSLRFTGLAAGSYRLVTRTNETACIDSAMLGARNVLHGAVTVSPGMAARMDVKVSHDCGTIAARVVEDGEPVPDAKVVLLLGESAGQADDMLADYANEKGEISFYGLGPGRYRLWAWRVDSFGSFVGPATLEGAGKQPAVVQVERGEHVSIDVPLLRREAASK